jgi:1,4-dihydroxy-2-naphthoate octaprenyltransferase
LKRIAGFFLYSSLYISFCAVLMVYQTSLLFKLPVSAPFLFFTFFATICSYNFHWYLTPDFSSPSKRVNWSQHHKTLHLGLYFIGIIGSIVCFFFISAHWFALLIATGITFLYSAPKVPLPFFRFLRKIAIGKTIFLATVWTYVSAILPVIIAGAPLTTSIVLFAFNRFFLIYAICILFDFRDREEDKVSGIRSLITLLDEKGIDRLFIFSMIAFLLSTVSLLLVSNHISPVAELALLIPGGILCSLYSYAKQHFTDFLYYFVLDGLMMLSGLLLLVLPI